MRLELKGIDCCVLKKKTPKFIIRRDVTFNKSAMFGWREKLDDFASIKDQGTNQKVEFEIETPKKITTNFVEQPENVQQLEP
jgi:hypothetical protein